MTPVYKWALSIAFAIDCSETVALLLLSIPVCLRFFLLSGPPFASLYLGIFPTVTISGCSCGHSSSCATSSCSEQRQLLCLLGVWGRRCIMLGSAMREDRNEDSKLVRGMWVWDPVTGWIHVLLRSGDTDTWCAVLFLQCWRPAAAPCARGSAENTAVCWVVCFAGWKRGWKTLS